MLVFVYGTLIEPERVATVLERDPADAADAFAGRATLEGLCRVAGRYPTLVPGGSADGRLLAIDETGLATLDEYEGVDTGLYVRVAVPIASSGPADRCFVYVGEPKRLGVDATWPGDGAFRDRVRQVVSRTDVVVRSNE
ncbi:gamma-glutamylcyclotransferase family protein [Natrinema marinum]|uniref:gamma-glutamylcyclotransferase family protein n=1 Tax=Natrinema marinum TaxID=2961598 RepID=UPI0020C842B4|nr:gamma-glutamylcyclotransferase family protein [Natrinema marinum]